jgi:hypothetical protein
MTTVSVDLGPLGAVRPQSSEEGDRQSINAERLSTIGIGQSQLLRSLTGRFR